VTTSFQLVLDTTAPSVSWGAAGGTTAGELLQIAYSADEPIDSADLTLADGRVLMFTIGAAVLSVNLPADTPAGPADVRVRDDVGNERVYAALIVLQGAIVPVPVPTPVARTLAPPPRTRRARLIVHVSRARVRSSCMVRARAHNTSRARVDRRSSIAARARRAGGARTATTFRLQSVASSRRRLQGELAMAVRRRDGPDQELLVLLLVD
jgi:hypothetical protein